MQKKPKPRPERFRMIVQKGALVPADSYTLAQLRRRNYKSGDEVMIEIKKAREGWYYRKAHLFGDMVAQNIEAFAGLDAHSVLKRLQVEGNIGCDEMAIQFPGIGPCVYRIPQSLAYENMDQGDFEIIYQQFCDYVRRVYWPSLTDYQIADLADLMPEVAA